MKYIVCGGKNLGNLLSILLIILQINRGRSVGGVTQTFINRMEAFSSSGTPLYSMQSSVYFDNVHTALMKCQPLMSLSTSPMIKGFYSFSLIGNDLL